MWEIAAALSWPDFLAVLTLTPLVLMLVLIMIFGKKEPRRWN